MGLQFVNALCLITAVSVSTLEILGHLKNYRKPMDQRLIVRILVMVPLFGASAYMNLYFSWRWLVYAIVLVKELYEAFVIYTFYTLLTNLLGGEREIIFTATGRAPVKFPGFKVDISDPQTFLLIKRLIIQYVWVRPLYSVLKDLNTSKSISILLIVLYNVSVTLSLNALMVFWVCLRKDLEPYHVLLKFLSVKMIVFFSYWQSLALNIANSLGFISTRVLDVWGQSLIIWESVLFAAVHWYAFPASDYYATFMFGFARLRIDAAFKDAFGIADLVHDFRMTFLESRYGHRDFDSVEAVLDHPDSANRRKRIAAGLRYKNGGRSKYWLPSASVQRLLVKDAEHGRTTTYGAVDGMPHYLHPPAGAAVAPSSSSASSSSAEIEDDTEFGQPPRLDIEDEHSDGEEALYAKARTVYGDYNYPVATVRESEEYVSFEERLRRQHILERI